jgi:hypothetical protein
MGTGTNRLMTVGRGVLLLAALLLAWAVVVLVTGGVVLDTRWGTLTSRAAARPFIAAGLLLLLYLVHFRHGWKADAGRWHRLSPPHAVVAVAIVVTLAVGFRCGARIAGGPDAAGYVSQAAMFVGGHLTVRPPEWVDRMTWANAALASAPIGYHPIERPATLAPTYSPGLPLLMAAFQVVAGPSAVFLVVPLLAAVAAWAAYQLGNVLSGPWAGVIAVVLLTSSPAFLVMTVQAMSDVPVTAAWTLALVSALRGRPAMSGLFTAAAILVRPNLVPLSALPCALLLVERDRRVAHAVRFALAAAPGALIVAALNWYYHGSPAQSGYGPFESLYSLSRVRPNLEQYARWFRESQTMIPLVGILAPFIARVSMPDRVRLLLVCSVFPAVVLALYLPYLMFQPQEWTYLRFLLPGYPALMAGAGVVCTSVVGRSRWRVPVSAAVAVLVAAVAIETWQSATARGVFALRETDERYARAVAHVHTLPANAVIVSLAHSGTLWFYTGRDVLRFDAIDGTNIDAAVAELTAAGHPVYLVGDPFEVDMFRARFAGTRAAARVGGAPQTDLRGSVVYRLDDSGETRRDR